MVHSQLHAQDLALRRLRDAVPGQVAISHRNGLTVCWGDMATLLGSLIFIKPIREGHAFFMIRLNAVDRPETGHTHSSGPCSVTVPDPRAFLCCLQAKSYGPRRARHGALLHLRNGCGTRRWSGNTSRLIHSDIHFQAVPRMEVAQRVHMIAESPVASPPPQTS